MNKMNDSASIPENAETSDAVNSKYAQNKSQWRNNVNKVGFFDMDLYNHRASNSVSANIASI